MKRYVIANWKMNLLTATASALLDELAGAACVTTSDVEVVVCPPHTLLQHVGDRCNDSLKLGAQNCHQLSHGAYTGEVSAEMLRDLGCEFVIVGHSERRRDHNEDDPLIGMKAQHAYRAGLRPIVCIGETLSQRQEGSTFAVLERQLEGIISAANPDVVASSIIAYEPVWAIGTGLAATAEQAQEVHAYIRAHLHGCGITTGVPLLYGGSVTANNAAELFTCRDIDGALVGGASLIADQFTSIVNAAKKA